jgi:phosphate transport system permease protein
VSVRTIGTTQKSLARRKHRLEAAIGGFLFVSAAISILTTAGIVLILGKESLPFFAEVSLWEFFTKPVWQPQIDEFGILPLFTATLMTSLIAMLIALPAGLAVAIYLAEYAPSRVRSVLKPILEILAGVPTVVYGFFALQNVTPALQGIFGSDRVDIYNTLSAGLVMGILILPLISSMCEDAISSVPPSLREGAYALGATKLEVSIGIVLPAALSGLTAAFIIGLSGPSVKP